MSLNSSTLTPTLTLTPNPPPVEEEEEEKEEEKKEISIWSKIAWGAVAAGSLFALGFGAGVVSIIIENVQKRPRQPSIWLDD